MYGRVIRCFPDKGYAFILGEDKNSYFLHYSNLNGEYIETGYQVFFVPFRNDRSDFNASKVAVIDAPEKGMERNTAAKKKKVRKHHKSCNAGKVILDSRKFQRFVKDFMREQKMLREERTMNNDKTHKYFR